jgi:hypothetical protein
MPLYSLGMLTRMRFASASDAPSAVFYLYNVQHLIESWRALSETSAPLAEGVGDACDVLEDARRGFKLPDRKLVTCLSARLDSDSALTILV